MNVFDIFRIKIIDIVKKLPLKIDDQALIDSFQVSTPKEKKFGDIYTNIALVLSRALEVNSLELAQSIADKLLTTEKSIIRDIDIIKPGFINICLHSNFWFELLNSILSNDLSIKLKNNNSSPELVNIEYVSANPTGPMHIGHGRGAVVGDVLANLYSFFGYSVTKEYYINDAGNQIKGLALSVYYRYCEILGKSINQPKDFYPGEYIIDVAKDLISTDGDKWLNKSENEILDYFSQYAVAKMMYAIKEDLRLLGIQHDVFSSEKIISDDKIYSKLKKHLKEKDLVYMGVLEAPKGSKAVLAEEDRVPNLLFRTSKFGDTADRVVEKLDGTKTYFASDISYHYNKLSRGFNKMIVVLGADHKGYEKRLQAIVSALSNNNSSLEAVFTEMVKLLKNKNPVKMSKRAGEFITLKDVLNEVPKDAFRIMMISRSNTSILEFDLANINEKTEKNPVFYIQYAYARIHSAINKAKEVFPDITEELLIQADKSLLNNEYELGLIKELSTYQKVLTTALNSNNVHLIFLLLLNISKSIHSWWSAGKNDNNLKFINDSNKKLTFARLSLLLGAKKVMFILFNIIGIDKPEQM